MISPCSIHHNHTPIIVEQSKSLDSISKEENLLRVEELNTVFLHHPLKVHENIVRWIEKEISDPLNRSDNDKKFIYQHIKTIDRISKNSMREG